MFPNAYILKLTFGCLQWSIYSLLLLSAGCTQRIEAAL